MTRAAWLVCVWACAASRAHADELGVRVAPEAIVLDGSTPAAVSAPAGARLAASVGEVRGGQFRAGTRREPGFAVIAAADGDRRGATVLRLIGRGGLRTQTSPGAMVTVLVAGASFGPVPADGRGQAVVSVDVPPGTRTATVVAEDRDGLRTRREIVLPEPAPVRGVVIGPAELGPGDTGRFSVYVIDDAGGWRDVGAAPPVVIIVGAGLRAEGPPRAAGPGRWDLPVVALAGGGGRAEITASVDGRPLTPARVRLRGRRQLRWFAGARAGAATAFTARFTIAAAVDAMVDLGGFSVGAEVTIAHGTGDERGALTQLAGAAVLRARLLTTPDFQLEALAGGGLAQGWSDAADDVAPLLFVGAAGLLPVGSGAALLDLRWAHVRHDGDDKTALGMTLTLGYRTEL